MNFKFYFKFIQAVYSNSQPRLKHTSSSLIHKAGCIFDVRRAPYWLNQVCLVLKTEKNDRAADNLAALASWPFTF